MTRTFDHVVTLWRYSTSLFGKILVQKALHINDKKAYSYQARGFFKAAIANF